MTDRMRPVWHLYLLRNVKELVEGGIVGYMAEGDTVETVHARYFKHAPMLTDAPPKDTAAFLYYRDAEAKRVQEMFDRQMGLCVELQLPIPDRLRACIH